MTFGRTSWFVAVGAALCAAAVASAMLCTRQVLPPGAGGPKALLAGLGGSRGILAEVLWYRINTLQREGRYAELGMLTEYLVNLDPANTEAWAFNAWNLAYNVSYEHSDVEEQWQWILRAQDLLDRGLEANPGHPALLRQQGWIWEHKVGGIREERPPHDYPKENLAFRERTAALPPPPTAAAFEGVMHTQGDWGNPKLRALECYFRGHLYGDALRALNSYLSDLPPPARPRLFPFFGALYTAAEPTLTFAEIESALALTERLLADYPGHPALLALRNHARHTLIQENAP